MDSVNSLDKPKSLQIDEGTYNSLRSYCDSLPAGGKLYRVASMAIREYLERQREIERIERRAKEIRETQSD